MAELLHDDPSDKNRENDVVGDPEHHERKVDNRLVDDEFSPVSAKGCRPVELLAAVMELMQLP